MANSITDQILHPDNGTENKKDNYIPVQSQRGYENTQVLYDGVTPITNVQPQLSQLEIKYAGPLIKNSVVENLSDLLKFSTSLNYQHRRVWVKEYGCEYYLDNGNGTRLENWKRAIGRLVIHTWSAYENYQAGDVVNYFGKLYVAKVDIDIRQYNEETGEFEFKKDSDGNIIYDNNKVPIPIINPGPSPLEREDIWQVVTGEIETYTWHFNNLNQIQIYTEIRNPRFEVCLGTVAKDETGNIKYNTETGLPIYENIEIVEACIRQGTLDIETGKVTQFDSNGNYYLDDGLGSETEDSDWNKGGVPYVIQLFTDEKNIDTYYDSLSNNNNRQQYNVIITVK